MNDPGLDTAISEDAKDVENQRSEDKDEEEEDEQAFLEPSRWWFASTAFPLIAGTFGPMASAFSICALVVHWRVYIPPGASEGSGIEVPDPKWLTAINAVQLAIALISNLFLLLNMARRVRFSIAQPITIIGWYISSLTLLALCSLTSKSGPLQLHPASSYAYTQAFYYAIFASVLYFLVATLMLITVWGAYNNHYDKEFQLTMSQRTLMLQTISFLVYLLAGAAVFCHVEGWKYLDAVYWADFTLLTVGVGDYAPTTHLGRSLLFPFAIGGIIILGLVIGSIRSLVLERGKVKMGTRMVEKQRLHLLKKLHRSSNTSILEPIKSTPSSASSPPGTSSSTTSTLTERQRRHEEFHMMRQVQARAHTKRRWTSLGISATTWFILWFAGAAIFRASEKPQGWSYFVSLYFSYTSLLTIGYGDIYPISNAGKAFFVFWSLLAIPSLTILISNMGDTIVKAIRDLTLWIGNFTVLPGEKGFKRTLKEGANTLTKGRLFDSDIEEMAPGILGESQGAKDEEDSESEGKKNDPESKAQNRLSSDAKREAREAKKEGEKGDKDALPENKRDYHFLLIREIKKVTKHLGSSPPRKYSFDEWAWFLKLVGEDEGDGEGHRMAGGKGHGEGGKGRGVVGEGEGKKWSWVGERSPLLGGGEEAEWILERLIYCLERELEGVRDEKKGKNEGDVREGAERKKRSEESSKTSDEIGEGSEEEKKKSQ